MSTTESAADQANNTLTTTGNLTTDTGGAVTSVAARTGDVLLTIADVSGAAPLASPALTGTPTAPTIPPGDSSTSLATTAFVANSFAPKASPTFTGTVIAPAIKTGADAGTIKLGAADDVVLARDAAGALAQRNGANAQESDLYNTYTDASNYERLATRWSTNVLSYALESLGTGTARNTVNWSTGGNLRAALTSSGAADSNFTIGNASCKKVALIGGTGGSAFEFDQAGSFSILAAANASVGTGTGGTLFKVAGTAPGNSFLISSGGLLQIGGTTSGSPALKPASAVLAVRLADDSADGAITAAAVGASGVVTSANGTAPAAGGSTTCGTKLSSTANLGFYVGTGAPTLSAAKGSIYSNTTAITTTTRLYVNTDGATTWTNLTTAA